MERDACQDIQKKDGDNKKEKQENKMLVKILSQENKSVNA